MVHNLQGKKFGKKLKNNLTYNTGTLALVLHAATIHAFIPGNSFDKSFDVCSILTKNLITSS